MGQSKLLIYILFITFFDLKPFLNSPKNVSGICKKVKDGDTIELQINGHKMNIRLAYIDAPEKLQIGQSTIPWGEISSRFLSEKILGKKVQVMILGRGYYGRAIGEVFYKKKSINLELIKNGLANIYSGSRFISIQSKLEYTASQMVARNKKSGIWSERKFLNPSYFRRRKRTSASAH